MVVGPSETQVPATFTIDEDVRREYVPSSVDAWPTIVGQLFG